MGMALNGAGYPEVKDIVYKHSQIEKKSIDKSEKKQSNIQKMTDKYYSILTDLHLISPQKYIKSNKKSKKAKCAIPEQSQRLFKNRILYLSRSNRSRVRSRKTSSHITQNSTANSERNKIYRTLDDEVEDEDLKKKIDFTLPQISSSKERMPPRKFVQRKRQYEDNYSQIYLPTTRTCERSLDCSDAKPKKRSKNSKRKRSKLSTDRGQQHIND